MGRYLDQLPFINEYFVHVAQKLIIDCEVALGLSCPLDFDFPKDIHLPIIRKIEFHMMW